MIVATVSAIYGLGDPQQYFSMILHLNRGTRIDQRSILRRLAEMQYTRNDNTNAQVELLSLSSSTGYCGTLQFLWTLLERARTKGGDVSLKRAFVSGAPLSTTLREELAREFGVSVFQGYGTADVGAIAYECEHACGWHVAPRRVVEVLEHGTGEIVVSVDNEVYPLVRFGTGDVSSFERAPCACGRTTPRLMGF